MSEGSPLLRTSTGLEAGKTVIYVRGEIDASTSSLLEAAIRRAMVGARHIVVDLSAVSFLDSAGLVVLISALSILEERGDELVLRSPSERVRRTLEITHLNERFALDPVAPGSGRRV